MDDATSNLRRRQLLDCALRSVLLATLTPSRLWAGGRPSVINDWLRQLVQLKDALTEGDIGVLDWQQRMQQAGRNIALPELIAWLDLDALTRDFRYGSALAEVADPLLPKDILGAAGMRGWFVRVFGLRRGGAIIPHVHNHMVSAHCVIKGSFHLRTHHRVQDLPDATVLRPSRDETLSPGALITMSDQRDNQHWLVAREQPSLTFDVGVVGLPASWDYGLQANRYHMIFVDPTVPPETDGRIVAPVIDFDTARARFALD